MATNESSFNGSPAVDPVREQEWQQIREALRGIRFGAVQVIIQDGVVVQIDRTEKRRLRRQPLSASTELSH